MTSPPRIETVQASTLGEICSLLGVTALRDADLAVADLTMGSWRGNGVAQEVCAQLGVPAPSVGRPLDFGRGPVPSYGASVSRLVDEEAIDYRPFSLAVEAASRVAEAMAGQDSTFLVLAPRPGHPWEPEDALFLVALSRGLQEGRVLLVETCDGSPSFPMDVPAGPPRPLGSPGKRRTVPGSACSALAPGVLSEGILRRLGGSDQGLREEGRLRSGHWVVSPEERPFPGEVAAGAFEVLAARAQGEDWLVAYAQHEGDPTHASPPFLAGQAWRRLGEGGEACALRLMRKALAASRSPLDQAISLMQLQALRIATWRFEDAASAPLSSGPIPPAVQGFLWMGKAWGLVMAGRAQEADELFTRALALPVPAPGTKERLYLQNISALARLKLGDVQGALAREEEIRVALDALPTRDWALEYVNAVNLARLHLARGAHTEAREAYARAFATTWGARSPADRIYVNFCLARLAAKEGQADEAVRRWILAALHWLALDRPETLARRTVRALAGAASPHEIAEAGSRALLHSLEGALAQTGRAVDAATEAAGVEFASAERAEIAAPLVIRAAVGAPGWGVCVADPLPSRPKGPWESRLAAVVAALLRDSYGAKDLARPCTVIVDDRFGREVPLTAEELMETALRFRAPALVFADVRHALDAADREHAERALPLMRARLLSNLGLEAHPPAAYFKRYLPCRALRPEETRLLSCMQGVLPASLLAERADVAWEDARPAMDRLRRDRVIETAGGASKTSGENMRRG